MIPLFVKPIDCSHWSTDMNMSSNKNNSSSIEKFEAFLSKSVP